MRKITILIPHNKMPHLHDLATIQCKRILSKLQKSADLRIIWVIFPAEEGTNLETSDPCVISASRYSDVLKIIDEVKPDLVLINGSMDFHNVSVALASRFRNIPMVVIFFRNFLHVISSSRSKSIKARIRKISSLPSFYMKQIIFLSKTLQKINFTPFRLTKFILGYSKMIFFSYFPISKVISGDINLCTNQIWKNKLIENGFEESSIFVVGDPYFDSIFAEVHNSSFKSITIDKVRILFCASTMFGHGFCSKKEENELVIDTINEILKHNDFEVSLKIHPSTVLRSDYEKEVLPNLSSNVMLYQQENLVDLINKHNIILTYGGTGAIHYGALMRKPIINLDFNTNATGNNVFVDDKIITQCKSLSNLASDIRDSRKKIISDSDVDVYVQKYIGIFDGRNTDRAADAISNFLNKKDFLI